MAETILILGDSGSGKSTSLRNLNHEETFIFRVVDKSLPFKGWKSKYNKENKNLFTTHNYVTLEQSLLKVNEKTEIKDIIIDDCQYLMSFEYMLRAKETGFNKFTEIAQKFHSLIMLCKGLREDLNVYFMSHTEETNTGKIQMKTIGKMLQDTITLEGLFTIVLLSKVEKEGYFFITHNDGYSTVKSPFGMFEEDKIPNDLKVVKEAINSYYAD